MHRTLLETTTRVPVEYGSFYLLNDPPNPALGYPELPLDNSGETLVAGSEDGIIFSSLLLDERAANGAVVTLRWLDGPPADRSGAHGSFHVAGSEIAFTTTTGTPVGAPVTPPYRGVVHYQITRELIGNDAPPGFPAPVPADEHWFVDLWQ